MRLGLLYHYQALDPSHQPIRHVHWLPPMHHHHLPNVFKHRPSLICELPKNRLALSALSGTDPKQVLTQRSAQIADTQSYNIKISLEGSPITNQRSSGRCWLFAATNVFRVAIMRRYNLKDFELSQSYLFFWDKLEKANYFLEQILDTVDEELDGRLVQALMASPVGDGGQWDMVANLVEKYGLVRFYSPLLIHPIQTKRPLSRNHNTGNL